MIKENKDTSKLIKELEFELQKIKFLKEIYIDLKISRQIFSSKLVNAEFDELSIFKEGNAFYMGTIKDHAFEYGGRAQNLKVFSIPRINLILHQEMEYNEDYSIRTGVIRFSKLFQTFKFKSFNPDILNKIRKEIMDYLRDPINKDAKIDYSNIDPKIKKLLNFG